MKQTTQQKTQVNKKGPHKYKNLKTLSDSFKEYEKEYPNSNLGEKMYKKICITFFKHMLKGLIDGLEIRLPLLGEFRIVKKKRDLSRLKVNWKATNKLWSEDEECKEKKQLVYYLNDHTKGFYYRFKWRKSIVKNISVYSFLPVRSAKQMLSLAIVEGNKDYLR
jgi:hypothetical protein